MISLFKRVNKTTDNIYGCEKVTSVPVDVPSIVIFGGDRTTSAHDANYYMSIFQNLFPTGVNIFATTYDINTTTPKKTDIERKNIFKHAKNNIIADPIKIISPEIVDLFNTIIVPRISDSKGKKYSFQQAIQNMRNLTIYTHCHGSVVAYHFQRLMQEKMNKLGYSKFQTAVVMQNLVVIQHAPVVPLTKNKFSTLSFISAYDSFTQLYKVVPKWILSNQENLSVSYFPKKYGNFIIAYQVSTQDIAEHTIEGLKYRDLMTPDGQMLFNAEENAIKNSIGRTKVLTPTEMVSGNNVDFTALETNGVIFQKMVTILESITHRERNQARANQK